MNTRKECFCKEQGCMIKAGLNVLPYDGAILNDKVSTATYVTYFEASFRNKHFFKQRNTDMPPFAFCF